MVLKINVQKHRPTRPKIRGILDDVSNVVHSLRRERSSVVPGSGAIKMGIGIQFGYAMIYAITVGAIFYSLGYNTGKKDGYLKGRSAGMRIGADRRVNNG